MCCDVIMFIEKLTYVYEVATHKDDGSRDRRSEIIKATWCQGAKEWRRREGARALAAQQRAERQVAAQCEIQRRGEDKHAVRIAQKLKEVDERETQLVQMRLQEELNIARMKQEEELAIEREAKIRKEMREEKLRQQIREQSEELRELRAQLRSAYVSKELAVQLAEKEAARLEAKLQEKRTHERQREAWAKHDQEEKEREQERLMRQTEHLRALKEQVAATERSRQEAFRLFLLEKQVLDEIVLRLQEEDQREAEAVMLAKKKTKAEIERFRAEQLAWREREKIRLAEEDKRIIAYLKEQEEREKIRREAEKHRAVEKSLVVQHLIHKIVEQEREREEREQLLWELAAEEQRRRAEEAAKLELQRRLKQRMELRQMRLREAELRVAKLQEQQRQEEAFRQQEMERLAEASRLEQLSAARKRAKQADHRREITKLLETRRKEREEAQRKLEQLRKEEEQQEMYRRELIEEERLKILEEHATRLLEFLPRGLVTNRELALLTTSKRDVTTSS